MKNKLKYRSFWVLFLVISYPLAIILYFVLPVAITGLTYLAIVYTDKGLAWVAGSPLVEAALGFRLFFGILVLLLIVVFCIALIWYLIVFTRGYIDIVKKHLIDKSSYKNFMLMYINKLDEHG